MTMDELHLPESRPLPNRALRREALEAEIGRRSRNRPRLLPRVAKWALATAAVSVVGALGVLTLVGQASDEPKRAVPAVGREDPAADEVLHLNTTIERDGQLIERIESWSVAGPPRRERIVIHDADPQTPPTEFEVGGGYLVWRFDARDNTIRRLTPSVGPGSIEGSSANWRRRFGMARSEFMVDVGAVVVNGIAARRFTPHGPAGRRSEWIVDTDTARLTIEEHTRRTESGDREVARVATSAEVLASTDETARLLSVRQQHPDATVAPGEVAPGGERAEALRRDLESDPAATDPAEVARSLPRGWTVFIGTEPTCVVVQAKVEYRCTLAKRSDPGIRSGVVSGIVDAKLRVSGGCRSRGTAGLTWECFLGDAAVRERILDVAVLGARQLGPSSG